MKSKTSLFSKAIWKHNFTGCWGLWAGLTVLYLMVLPVNAYVRLADRDWASYGEAGTFEAMMSMVDILRYRDFCVMVFAVAGVVAAMAVFSYLFTGRNSNMVHTYPVSRTGLFVTNFVSGLLFLTVPVMVCVLLALAVGASFGAVNGEVVKVYLIWFGISAAENLFFFSAAVCMLMFVGNIVAVPCLYFILNFAYMGCVEIVDEIINAVCYGLVNSRLPLVEELTPIAFMAKRIGIQEWRSPMELAERLERGDGFGYLFTGMEGLAVYIAAAVVFAVIAWFAYQKKHIETAGDVVTVGWLKPIFRWGAATGVAVLGSAVVCGMFFYRTPFWVILVSALGFGVTAFFVAQMLLERTVRVFTGKRLRECAAFAVVVSVCYIGLDADVLGLEKQLPAMDEIKAVRMSDWNLSMYAEDAQAISWVQDINRQIVESKKEFRQARSIDCEDVSITYVLKNGSSVLRHYEILASDAAGSVSEQIFEYAGRPDVILKRYFGIHYPDITVYGGTLTFSRHDPDVMETVRISEADAQKLYGAVVQDLMAWKFDKNYGRTQELAEAETAELVTELTLNVYDEAGFKDASYYEVYGEKLEDEEGTVGFMLDEERFAHAVKVLDELGYLSGREVDDKK